jgi:hypothetical protein
MSLERFRVRSHDLCVMSKLGVSAVGLLLSLSIAAGNGVAGTATRACRMSDFTLGIGPRISEKTGQNTLALRLVNRRAATCFVRGYPNVKVYDRQGVIPFLVRHGGDQMLASRSPRRVVVQQNRAAFVLLNHYRCDLRDLRTATSVRIRLAGMTSTEFASLKLAVANSRLRYCGKGDPGSILTVSPFEPTIKAAMRG